MTPLTYTVEVSSEIAEQYTAWTRVDSLRVDWFKINLHHDGSAEVVLSVGDEPPEDRS